MNTPVKFVGMPDGPKRFIAELGQEVSTFTTDPGGKMPALHHHVPLKMRGDYRPEDLANYDAQKSYRTDPFGRVLCYGRKADGARCSKRAVNRYPRCDVHGGRLHPMDKLVKDDEQAANNGEAQAISRYRQFVAGQISVDDLDDEELSVCGFRTPNGRIFKPKNIPREMAQAFTRAIYERAQSELRSLTVDAARTMGEIMRSKTIEPDIRLKAALSIVERNLGKTPQVVALTDAKVYEEVFDGILHVRSERPEEQKAIEPPIDAEVVGPEQRSADTPDAPTDTDDRNTAEKPSFDRGYGTPDGPDVPKVRHTETAVGQPTPYEPPGVSARDARLFARNEAILAQTIEIKPFEYDLTDHSKEVAAATKKRYASRALGVDLTEPSVPLAREETVLPNGDRRIKYQPPEAIPVTKRSNSKDSRRKAYTLSDFT